MLLSLDMLHFLVWALYPRQLDIRAHDQVIAYPFETFFSGHMDQPGTRQDVLL